MFITFNTQSQAKNYIKRNKFLNYAYNQGCGCCFENCHTRIEGNKLVKTKLNYIQGHFFVTTTIIGKIKNKWSLEVMLLN